MNLDLPPRLKNEGKFQECLDISLDNFKYFQEKQDGLLKRYLQNIGSTKIKLVINQIL